MLTITLRQARKANACSDGWKIIKKEQGRIFLDTPIPIGNLMDSAVPNAALWSLVVKDRKLAVKYLLDCLEHAQVVTVFEKSYPGDKRVRECVEVTERWLDGTATDEELRDAAYAARAAYSARAAYAARAAYSAYAVYAAAHVGAAAAHAAAGAAYAASYDAERDWHKQHLREILSDGGK